MTRRKIHKNQHIIDINETVTSLNSGILAPSELFPYVTKEQFVRILLWKRHWHRFFSRINNKNITWKGAKYKHHAI